MLECTEHKSLSLLFVCSLLDLRTTYLTEKKHGGQIRPWQCSWRADFGISGMVDPEVVVSLIELYLHEGLPS